MPNGNGYPAPSAFSGGSKPSRDWLVLLTHLQRWMPAKGVAATTPVSIHQGCWLERVPLQSTKGGRWKGKREDGEQMLRNQCFILMIHLRTWLQGFERVHCSPCPPQSKQQKQSYLPHTTPPRDAENKQESSLSSQMLQEQGEGRRYPPTIYCTPGDAGWHSPPCLPLHHTCNPALGGCT